MIILAADTSTSYNSVAVCDDERVLAESIVQCGRSHSERLVVTVDWVLTEAGIKLDDVQLLAISIGPGSFTGVRVGTAAWKGFAFGKRLPLVGVPTLDAMTRLGAFREHCVCPLLDARMGEVFGALYRFADGVREKVTQDLVCPVEKILENVGERVVFLGDGADLYRDRIVAQCPQAVFIPALCSMPRASAVAAEGWALVRQGACTDAALVEPVYLRKSQAEENRAKAEANRV